MIRTSLWQIVAPEKPNLRRNIPPFTTCAKSVCRRTSLDGTTWNMKRKSKKIGSKSKPRYTGLQRRTREELHMI